MIMEQQNKLLGKPFFTAALAKNMLIGGAIALTLMIIFLSPLKHPDPEWGKFWIVRPLLVISFAGATGGAFYHIMGRMRAKGGWKIILSHFIINEPHESLTRPG